MDFIVFYKIRMWYILTHCMAISNTHPMISSSWYSGVPLKREDGGNRLSIESILPEPILGFFHPSSALWYQSVSHYCSYHIYLWRKIGTHTAFEYATNILFMNIWFIHVGEISSIYLSCVARKWISCRLKKSRMCDAFWLNLFTHCLLSSSDWLHASHLMPALGA